MQIEITLDELKERVSYDPSTGLFLLLKSESKQLRNQLPYELGKVPDGSGYKVAMLNGRTYKLHRLAVLYMTGKWPDPDLIVDHIDRDSLNNRWDNLRQLTRMENIRNQNPVKSTKSRRTGVSIRLGKKKPYYVHIRVNKILKHLGCFTTLEEAVSTRKDAELKYFSTTHRET